MQVKESESYACLNWMRSRNTISKWKQWQSKLEKFTVQLGLRGFKSPYGLASFARLRSETLKGSPFFLTIILLFFFNRKFVIRVSVLIMRRPIGLETVLGTELPGRSDFELQAGWTRERSLIWTIWRWAGCCWRWGRGGRPGVVCWCSR